MAVAHFFVIYVAAKIFFIAYGASDNSISGVCEFSNTRLSCGPGHRCVQLNQQSWACLCKPGYSPTGTQQDSRCVEIDICKSVGTLCLNDGICERDKTNPAKYQCKCASGFSGLNCERKESICDTGKFCANGGKCIPRPSSTLGFQCICTRGYEGDTCEVPVSIGIGGAGAVLDRGSLVFMWGLWIFLMITFLYCGFNLVSGCLSKGFYKIATGPVANAT